MGGVFCKVENGFFVKKNSKMGVFFVKTSGKWGCFCKKVDLSSTQGALCTVSVFFYFTFYLFGGGRVRTQRTPLPTSLDTPSRRRQFC